MWKIQLTIAIYFISFLGNDVITYYVKNDSIEMMINDGGSEVIKELFDSLKNRYQNNLESMKGREFVFD